MNRTVLSVAAIGLAVMSTVSCSDKSATAPNGIDATNASNDAYRNISSVTVSLLPTSVTAGDSATATAVLRDNRGRIVNGTVTWSASASSVATVSAAGIVHSLAPGTASITATRGSKTGSATLTVTAPAATGAIATVTVSVASSTITPGQTTQGSAVAEDASGTVVTGQSVTWSSLTPSTLSVSSTGMVQGIASGTGQIQAQVSGITGVKSLNVVVPLDLASADFNDGTYGVFHKEDTDGSVSIVDDPTGSGRGKVVRIHYAGVNQDRNRSVYWEYPAGIGLGQTIYSRHRVYHVSPFNTNTFIGRKYIYWQEGSPSLGMNFAGQPFWAVVGVNGSEVAVDLGHFNQGGTVSQVVANNIYPGNIKADTWYTIETQMTVNSTPSSTDGIFRLWVNGVLIYEKTNFRWTDPAWPVDFAKFGFHWFFVGEQTSYTQGSFDEIRLIDDVAFSTKRIGQ
jgi:hypothetical protein